MGKPKTLIVLVVFMALISFMCLSLGTSYSYMTRSKIVSQQTIITGNFNVTADFEAIDNGNATTLTAMSDNEGVNQTTYATITVTKDTSYNIFYSLSLAYDLDALCNATSGCSEDTTGDVLKEAESKLLPLEFIRFALYSYDTVENKIGDLIIGPMSLADLTVASATSNSVYDTEYNLYNNFILSSSEYATRKFVIKTWVDKDIDEDYDERLIYIKAKVEEEAMLSKSGYNLGGDAYDSSGSLIKVTTGKVYIPGRMTTSINANYGSFTLGSSTGVDLRNAIAEGTYSLYIEDTNSDNATYGKYSTTFHLENSYTGTCTTGNNTCYTVTETGGSTVAVSNQSIGGLAYTYYTTINRIYDANPSLKSDSNTLITGNVVIPKAYLIQATDRLGSYSLSNLKVSINSDNETLTIAKG